MHTLKIVIPVALLALLCSAVMLTGCVLSPGAYLDPSSQKNVHFKRVELTEKEVNPSPVRRQQWVEKPSHEQAHTYQYLIGPHDVLSVRVWNNPDLTTNLKAASSPFDAKSSTIRDSNDLITQRQQSSPEGVEVQANGNFFFPFAGDVAAAGKTVTQVRTDLTKKLAKYVRDPQVSVRVLEFNSQKAQIIGEVKFPRPVPITSKPLRILDAIALAQGLKDSADKAEAIFLTGNERRIINMAKLLDGDLSQNYLMKDGDVLNIDSNRYRQIVIMGEVNKPIAMPYDQRGMSLNDALVTASGISQLYANAKGVYVLRNNKAEGETPTIFRLNMENATALLLAARFPLNARDVVYVDTAGVSRWNRVVNQLIPTTNGINSFTNN
ncbi:polysaccharide biosynthesis/export family protein [Endozoicomonas sp.]|nr:polysaccharide biosynthesis/export family protein [Endozoicomonas sp.]